MIKSKKCNVEGCRQSRFSSGFCKSHQSLNTTKPPKSLKKISEKGIVKKKEKKEYTQKQFKLFEEFYELHQTKRCFECNKIIFQLTSCNVHHCLPKHLYKSIALDTSYWVLVCFDCHQSTETNINNTPKIKEHTVKLKEIYLESKKKPKNLLRSWKITSFFLSL